MRGIRTAGVGFALAISTAPGLSQTAASPGVPPAPAARIGRAVPVDDTPVVRGAAPDPRTGVTPLFPNGLFRAQTPQGGATPAPGGTGQPGPEKLSPPRQVEGNPMVTEQRNGQPVPAAPGTVVPGANLGGPVPLAVSPGVVMPGYPSYVVPGSGAVPYVPGPVTGVPCDAGTGAVIPVTPSAPSLGYGQAVPAPAVRLEDPYLGVSSNPLFPRARAAVANTVANTLGGDRFTFGAEYLLWFARAQQSPPLLTTGPVASNGILGQPGTQVIFGNDTLARSLHSGARFSGTYWLNDCWGLDANVWFLGRNAGEFVATSDRFPVLARPFFDVNNNQNFSQLIASPGLSVGSARVNYDTSLWGAEANVRRPLFCLGCSRVDGLIGFRNLNLSETLQVTENFARTANSNTGIGVPSALSGTVVDRFRTENHFYGVNLGLTTRVDRGWWFAQGRAGVGLGTVFQQAQINGSQTINTTTGVTRSEGGLLALPGANIGTFSQTRFGVVPEAALTLGLNLTPRLKVGVGYNFMYINSVVRPAGQIDTGLDVTRIPNFPLTPTPPAVAGVRPSVLPLKTTDFFVQGVTFSLFWTW